MSTPVVMFDDVNVDLIPADATHIAAYADGTYQNLDKVKARFPQATILTIDVRGYYRNGDCLDVEPGDATNADAVAWFKAREGKTATPKPILYTSAGNVDALIGSMRMAGISRDRYFLWSAHYTGQPHICGSCGYPKVDGTQWTDHSHDRSLDESLINDYVFAQPVHQPSAGARVEEAIKQLRAAKKRAQQPQRRATLAAVIRKLLGLRK